jgi:uncharacterized protein (DUF697 family)
MSMNKKRLPKAIRRTAEHLRPEPPIHAADMTVVTDEGAAPFVGDGGAVVEVTSASPWSAGRALASRPLAPMELNAVRRLSRARAIVERYATYSAAGALIPLPIINIASVMAIILRMVKALSDLYGVPFERDRARAIVVGLAGGATPTGIGAATASTLSVLVPASALIGLAVSSVTAVACTRSIGRVFVEHFERGEALHDFATFEKR